MFFCVEIVFGYLEPMFAGLQMWNGFYGGYSLLSFVGLYLLGRAVSASRSKWLSLPWHHYLGAYFLVFAVSTLLIVFAFLVITGFPTAEQLICRILRVADFYTSPFVIAGSLFLFLAFRNITLSSKFVNHIAKSVLGVFMLGSARLFGAGIKTINGHFSGIVAGVLIFVFLLGICGLALIVDQFRLLLWNRFARLFPCRSSS